MIAPFDLIESVYCLQLNGGYYLVRSNTAGSLAALAALAPAAFTPVYLRYAFPQYGTLRPFFPAMVADDWGKLYRGLDCLDWLINNGLLYPRSDVAGLWPDGTEDQFVIKKLDLSLTLSAYVTATTSEFPGQILTAAIELVESATFVLAPGGNFPARLGSAIPIFQLNAALPFSKTIPLIPQVAANPHVINLDSVS